MTESNAASCPRCGLVYLPGRRYCPHYGVDGAALPRETTLVQDVAPAPPPPLLAYGYAVGGFFNIAQTPARLATPVTRLSAFALDLIVLFGAAVGVATVAGLLGVLHLLLVGQVLLLASVAAAYVYPPLFWSTRGQTPGMMVLRLRVVSADGERLTARGSIVRYIGCHAGLLAAGAGFLVAFWDDGGLCWHDKLAHTIVVHI